MNKMTQTSQAGRKASIWTRVLAATVVVVGAWGASAAGTEAHARGGEHHGKDLYFSIGVTGPGVAIGASNMPPAVVYPAPPVVYPAPAVVYPAPQVVYQPPRVVYEPAPYYRVHRPQRAHRHHGHRHHGHRHHRGHRDWSDGRGHDHDRWDDDRGHRGHRR
ncbi:hypothetical protein [Hydrogenophaga sp. 5NK40-0174]|uniref:hypothetical protein n=1 Tax=Hydrogenophaga sp. 5NK40-0174 TaxID=3127649 RepID=UPI003105D623